MNHKDYSNFVRQTSEEIEVSNFSFPKLSGKEARKLYLEEVQNVKDPTLPVSSGNCKIEKTKVSYKRKLDHNITINELFLCVQNNNVEEVKSALDTCPEQINLLDEFGWSLLMIACQANSVDTVKELLKRGIDTSIRDKAGNSAQSLIIKNKNLAIADLLLSHKPHGDVPKHHKINVKLKEEYRCKICGNKKFPDRQEHLASTLHNINASRGKKIPMKYVIPESNKGYQIMLKEGWDKETGLGPNGAGTKYPIKATMKKDRTGLGSKQKVVKPLKDLHKHINKRSLAREQSESKLMEIKFRREFY
ncbi:unnamed protein product [Leptosia nina]|uniref:G-patch domain-containing protein n=1 Tax=Leptosia nina TaxID=320188 RepID=A0AAV1K5B3_9NEOP